MATLGGGKVIPQPLVVNKQVQMKMHSRIEALNPLAGARVSDIADNLSLLYLFSDDDVVVNPAQMAIPGEHSLFMLDPYGPAPHFIENVLRRLSPVLSADLKIAVPLRFGHLLIVVVGANHHSIRHRKHRGSGVDGNPTGPAVIIQPFVNPISVGALGAGQVRILR